MTVVTKLLWPSPPGAGATPPVGPNDPEWHGNRSENVSSRTAASGNAAIQPNNQSTTTGDHTGSIKPENDGPIPALSDLNEQTTPRPRASSNRKSHEGDGIEKPTVNIPVDQVVIRIEVRDTGIGIKKKDVHDAKLFSPYVQVCLFEYASLSPRR